MVLRLKLADLVTQVRAPKLMCREGGKIVSAGLSTLALIPTDIPQSLSCLLPLPSTHTRTLKTNF